MYSVLLFNRISFQFFGVKKTRGRTAHKMHFFFISSNDTHIHQAKKKTKINILFQYLNWNWKRRWEREREKLYVKHTQFAQSAIEQIKLWLKEMTCSRLKIRFDNLLGFIKSFFLSLSLLFQRWMCHTQNGISLLPQFNIRKKNIWIESPQWNIYFNKN